MVKSLNYVSDYKGSFVRCLEERAVAAIHCNAIRALSVLDGYFEL